MPGAKTGPGITRANPKSMSRSSLSHWRFSPSHRYFMGAKTHCCSPDSCLNSARPPHHNDPFHHRREELVMSRCIAAVVLCLISTSIAAAADAKLPLVAGAEAQPVKANAKRVAEALDYLGQPLSAEQRKELDAALAISDDAKATKAIQEVFDPLAIAGVSVNPESRVKVA